MRATRKKDFRLFAVNYFPERLLASGLCAEKNTLGKTGAGSVGEPCGVGLRAGGRAPGGPEHVLATRRRMRLRIRPWALSHAIT